MESHHHRTLISGFEALFHDASPQPARSAELGDLLEEIIMDVEEERQAAGKLVNLEPSLERGFDVSDRIGQGERKFLHRSRTGFADVIARNRNSIPVGNFAA